MSEQAFLLGKTKSLVGIVTEPSAVDRSSGRPAVLLLNAGLIHRVGPNRIYVKIARQLAATGFLVLRFDLSGIGDSRSRSDGQPFHEAIMTDVQEAMDFLTLHRGVDRFILMGICSGANNSLRAAHADPRIVGAVLIESYFFSSFGYYLYVYKKRLFKPRSWWRLLTMKSDLWNIVGKNNPFGSARSQPGQNALNRNRLSDTKIIGEIRDLLQRGIHLSLIYCADSPSYYNHYLRIKPELGSLSLSGKLEVTVFDQSDHIFTLVSNQEALVEAILDWAKNLLPTLSATSSDVKKEVVG
ncbi:MAG: alpha/beta fold hydrolase [Candidatus Binatia bacterium]